MDRLREMKSPPGTWGSMARNARLYLLYGTGSDLTSEAWGGLSNRELLTLRPGEPRHPAVGQKETDTLLSRTLRNTTADSSETPLSCI